MKAALSIFAVLAILAPAAVQAQPAPTESCPEATTITGSDTDRLKDFLRHSLVDGVADVVSRIAPDASQGEAPSTAGETATVVDSPSLTNLLGLAVEQELIETSADGILTAQINPFFFKTLGNPDALEWYEYTSVANTSWRRVAGSVSFGGQGEKFDRDGDGTADDSVKAEELTDMITWELSYRFFGSRDRRDARNWLAVVCRLGGQEAPERATGGCVPAPSGQRNRLEEVAGAVDALAEVVEANLLSLRDEQHPSCLSKARVAAFARQSPELQAALAKLESVLESTAADREKLFDEVDNSLIFSLAVGGTERRVDELGPDKSYAALRLAGPWNLEGVLQYSTTDSLGGAPEPQTWKLGAKWTWLLFEQNSFSKDGIAISFAGAYEMFDDVPEAAHDTKATFGLSAKIPIAPHVELPLSVVWANHADFLGDQDEVRGHVGFTVKVADMFKKPSQN